jgi:hypothetical protein
MDATRRQNGNIPMDALLLAQGMISTQQHVPVSPAQFSDDGVLLCAGACLAAAGLELYESYQARAEFEECLLRTRDSSLIVAAFERLGWPAGIAQMAINRNDQSSSSG